MKAGPPLAPSVLSAPPPAPEPQLPAARQVYVLGVLLLMYVLAYMDRNVLALLVDPIKHSLGITDVQFSLLHGFAFGAFYAIFGLPMGYLVDRFSRRRVIFGGIAMWSAATVAFGLVRNFSHMALARFAVGAGEATLVPAAYSTITGILPRHRAALGIAIFSAGSSLGGAIAIAVGGLLMHRLTAAGGLHLPVVGLLEPWRAVMVIIGLPGLLIALLAFTIPETGAAGRVVAADAAASDAPPSGEPAEPFLPFLRENAGYLLLMIGGLIMVSILAVGVAVWLPALLMRQFGMDIGWVGLAVSLISLSGLLGFVSTGLVSDYLYRRGRKDAHILPILCGLPIIVVAAVVGFHFAKDIWLLLVCAVVIHILGPMGNSIASHVQLATPPSLRGRMAAVKVACQHLCGLTLGPLLVALVTDDVFADPKRVGDAMAMMVAVIGTLGILLLALARAPARAAIARQEARDRR